VAAAVVAVARQATVLLLEPFQLLPQEQVHLLQLLKVES
jgi:hypothetical protein